MGSGFTEIGLVLFTTMAPAGAVAFVLVALAVLVESLDRTCSAEDRLALLRHGSRYLIIPLAVCVVGLIASATQLGTPANALNAFNGLGRSPLSNEVTCSVIFLALAGVYWLTSYYDRVPAPLARLWLGCAMVAALVMVGGIGFAYRVPAIPTWNTPFVPVNLWLAGLYGGPILAAFTLAAARLRTRPGYPWLLTVISGVGLVGEVISCSLQDVALSGYANGVVTGDQLVPAYPAMIVGFAVLGALGLAGTVLSLRSAGAARAVDRPDDGSGADDGRRRRLIWAASLVATFLAIFLVRFAFYGLHMTIGM